MITLFLALAACDATPVGSATAAATAATAATPPAAPPVEAAAQPGVIVGTVVETLAAGNYTYTRVKVADGTETWAAAPGAAPAMGSTVSVPTGLPMADFHSETLARDFAMVYFTEALTPVQGASAAGTKPAWHPTVEPGEECAPLEGGAAHTAGTTVAGTTVAGTTVAGTAVAGTTVAGTTAAAGPPAGPRTVAQVWAERATLGGRQVALKGEVVKFTAGVMGKNWIHLKDGSGESGKDDLTITSMDVVQVGDRIEATGIVAVDKDFGYGYRYEVIVTDAHVKAVAAGG